METKIKIMESVIKESLRAFPVKISTISVSSLAKTSEANIFRIFKTKNNLLIETFLYIDNKIGNYVNVVIKEDVYTDFNSILEYGKKVWMKYLDFFVKHYEYGVYYSSFRKCKLYNIAIAKRQEENYTFLAKLINYIDSDLGVYNNLPYNLFWSFILDSTLMIARRMAEKEIEYTDNNIEHLFHLIFDGLINLVTMGVKHEEN